MHPFCLVLFCLFCFVFYQANPKFVEKVDNILKRSNSTLGKLSISSRDNAKIEVSTRLVQGVPKKTSL